MKADKGDSSQKSMPLPLPDRLPRAWQNYCAVILAFFILCVLVSTSYAQTPSTPRSSDRTSERTGERTGQERPGETRPSTSTTPTMPGELPPPPSTLPRQPTQPTLEGEERREGEGVREGADDATARPNTTAPRAGRVRAERRRVKPEKPLYFTAQYATRFDDNVLPGDSDTGGDIVSLPQVGFGYTRVSRRSLARIDYLGGAEVYHRNSSLNGLVHTLSAGWEYDLSRRTIININDTYVQRPNPTRFAPLTFGGAALPNAAGVSTNSGALNTLTSSRTYFNQFTIGLTHQVSRNSSVRTSYSHALTRFSNAQLIDTAEHALEFGYGRQISRTTSFDLGYRYGRFTTGSNTTSHSFIPTIVYQRSERMRLRAGAGLQQVKTAGSSDNNSQLFWTAMAEMTYTIGRRSDFALNYSAGVGTGGGLAGITRNHVVLATYGHGREKLQLEFRGGYSRSSTTQLGTELSPLVSSGFTNNEVIFGTNVAYPIANKLALFFDYSYARQFGSSSISRNLFSVGINFDTRRSARTPRVRPTAR